MSKGPPKNKLGRPPTRRTVRRSSSLRSRPLSTMPSTESGKHALFTQIASLQSSIARQEKIREALLRQVARCDEEIARAERESYELMTRAGVAPVRQHSSAPRGGGAGRDGAARRRSTREAFESLRDDSSESRGGRGGGDGEETDSGFHYQY